MSTDAEPEPLLAQVAWIHALARRLVLDEATAADVAQDALVVALERDEPAPRRWLAGVVRMLARERARRDARRRVREQLVARPEAQDVAADVVARAELERRVAAAALALPEPNRSTLLLRYRDGLPPRVIARRLELPLETVQSRLRRALRRLREDLRELAPDAGNDRSPARGCAFLIPLAARARTPLATTAPLAVLGATAMKKGYAVAALLLVIALVVVAEPWDPGARTPTGTSGHVALESSVLTDRGHRELTQSEASTSRGSERIAVASPDAAARPAAAKTTDRARVHGRVRAGSGDAVGASRVIVRVDGGGSSQLTAITDAAGAYEILLDAPAIVRSVEVEPGRSHIGSGPIEPEVLVTAARPLEIDLVVDAGSALRGIVVDDTGEPVPHASVHGWCSRTPFPVDLASTPHRAVLAGPDGRFELPHLGRHVFVAAQVRGHVPRGGLAGEFVPRSPGGVADADLRLVVVEPHAIAGRLVDDHRRPVAGARVRVDTTIGSAFADRTATQLDGLYQVTAVQVESVTDDDGRFRLAGLPAGTWGVDVMHDELQPFHRRLPAGEHDVLLEARRGLVARARVVGPDGRPVAGARVRVVESGRHERWSATDSSGRFSIGGLEPDRRAVAIVVAADLAPGAIAPLGSASAASDSTELRLEPAQVLAGRVVDVAGAPVIGAAVHAVGARMVSLAPGHERPLLEFTDRARVRTDIEGWFRFEGLHDGRFQLRASAPGEPARTASVEATAGSTDLLLQLPAAPPSVTVTGTVRDAVTGERLDDFHAAAVRWSRGERRETSLAHHDARGAMCLDGVPPGTFRVSVAAPGYADWTSEQFVAHAGELHLDVALHPARTLRFRIVPTPGTELPDDLFASFETLDGRPIDTATSPLPLARGSGNATEPAMVAGLPGTKIMLRLRTPVVAGRSGDWRVPVDAKSASGAVVDVVVDFARDR